MTRRALALAVAIALLAAAGASCRRRQIVIVRPPIAAVSPAGPSVIVTVPTKPPTSAPSNQQAGGGNSGGSGASKSQGSGGSGGNPSTTQSAGLPKTFPAPFPIPPGNRAVSSLEAGGRVFSVWFAGPQRQDQLASYFANALPAAGWTLTPVATASGPIRSGAVYAVSGHGWSGHLAIGEGYPAAAGYEGAFSFFVRLAH